MTDPIRLRRRPGWEVALPDFLKAAEGRPFCWGQNDCVLFLADWTAILTGQDFAARHRGKYKTARGAAGVLKRMGAADPAGLIDLHVPRHEAVLLARRGDAAAVPAAADCALCVGIVDDSGSKVAVVAEAGLARYPLTSAKVAWRIG
ncbi:MAG: hypothetical protein R8L07_03380 [Alphaproteobacteria bacterium]|nr:hypothetical protein [Alphaproteobacteria bacterium]